MQSTRPKTLTILDPTSLLGRGVTERIGRALPQVRRRMFHTGEERDHLIAEVTGEAALVPPLADPDALDGSDVVLVTARPPTATCAQLLDWLRLHPDVALLDCSQPGIAGSEARCVADRLPAERPARLWYHLADPALAAPFRLVAALASLEPEVLHLTVVCPVATLGAEALDELAAQGATRLSGHPMHKPDLLPAVLAFDLAPAGSGRSGGLEAQLGEIFPHLECRVHAIDAGVFHGYLATALVRCASAPSQQRLRSLVRSAGDLRLMQTNKVLTATEAVERGSVVVCGDLQAKGSWISAWLLADGLAVGNDVVIELLSSLSAW